MISELKDFSRLCIHTMTTKPWSIEECAKYYSAAGIRGITVWRNVLEGKNLNDIDKLLNDYFKRKNLKVDEMIEVCRIGHKHSQIKNVEVKEEKWHDDFKDFKILRF